MKKVPNSKEASQLKPKIPVKGTIKSPSSHIGGVKEASLQPEVLPYTSKIVKKPLPKKPDPGIPSFQEFQVNQNKNKQAKGDKGKPSFHNRDENEESMGYQEDRFDPRETYNVSATGTFNGRFTNTGENRYVPEDNGHDFDNEVIEEEEYTHGGGHNNSTFHRLDQSDRMYDTQHFHEFPKKNNFKIDNHMNIDKIALFKYDCHHLVLKETIST